MHTKLCDIVNLLLEKEIDDNQKQKFLLIKDILNVKEWYFKIDANTACTIIKDLGFNREEAINIYQELISSKNFN